MDGFLTTTSGTVKMTSGTFYHLATMSNSAGGTQVSLPAITVDAACSTDGSNQGGSTTINVVTTPLNIVLAGAVVLNGSYTDLTGQACSSSWFVAQSGGRVYATLSNYNWDVESQEGASIVGGYVATQGSGSTLSVAPFNNPNITFYDGVKDTVTINATATATFPDNTTATVNSSQKVTVVKPTATIQFLVLGEYDNFAQHPHDTYSSLGANETYSGAMITMPPGFTGGTGCFAQMISSTTRTDTRGSGGNYTIKVKLPNGTWVAIPTPCLDTNYPYPYGQATQWPVGSSGSGVDQPNFPVSPTLNSDDPYNADWFQASGNDNFKTWIMYTPNTSAAGNIWVPLSVFDWSWSNTASLSQPLPPNTWQTGTFTGDSGGDFAPTGIWPTWNTWVPYSVINNNSTGQIAMHE